MKRPISLFGIPFLPLTLRESRKELLHLLAAPRPAKVYTPNASILLAASRSRELTRLLRGGDLLLPDGAGVVLASKRLSTPLPERITGIDTAEWLLRYSASAGLSVYFLGGKEGVAAEAAGRWQRKLPALRIKGTHHGYFEKSGKENEAVLAELQEARPDLLFVCFGFPEQERWIDRHAHKLPSLRLAIGLGGALDVWSGRTRRAPRFLQRMGLEWLWRTLRSPKRLGNFITLPRFFFAVLRERRRCHER